MASRTAARRKAPAESLPEAPVAPANASAPAAVECNDPGRKLFYDRIGQFFYDEADVSRFDEPKTCSQCGKPIEVGMIDGGRVLCGAQRSLSMFRYSWQEQADIDAGKPAPKRGYASFVSKRRGFLITADFVDVITSVAPTKPLPADMNWYRDGTGANWLMILKRFLEPLKGPVVFAEFSQNATMPLTLSQDVNVIQRCGGDRTVPIDVARVREILEAARAMGAEDLHRLAVLRNKRMREETLPEKDRKALLELLARFRDAGLGDAYPPSVGEDAYGYALRLLGVEEA